MKRNTSLQESTVGNNQSLSEKWWWFWFTITLVGIVAVTIVLVDSKDLPITIIGAVLGVAMTVFATFFLFKGQSKQQIKLLEEQHEIEREQEKDSEIFKQKLNTYNRFLDALCKYVTESTEINKKVLIFHTMAIRMHFGSSNIDSFDENVTRILTGTGEDIKEEVRQLVVSLNEIAGLFRNELYGESPTVNSKKLEEFAKAIEGSQEEPTTEEREAEVKEEENEDNDATRDNGLMSWDAKVKDLDSKGWTVNTKADSINLKSLAWPVEIAVYRKKGKYVIEATKPDDSNFSQSLKENFKGARRYGTWWRELPISNYGVTEGTLLAQLPENDKARASVMKWIDKLTGFVENNLVNK